MKIKRISGLVPFTDREIDINLNGKNLILVGSNGSGKTKTLDLINQFIHKNQSSQLQIANYYKIIKEVETQLAKSPKEAIENKSLVSQINQLNKNIKKHVDSINRSSQNEQVKDGNIITKVKLEFEDEPNTNGYINMFFNANRQSSIPSVDSVTSMDKVVNEIKQQARSTGAMTNAGGSLEKYLVNWEVKSALEEKFRDKPELSIETWKQELTNNLKILLDDQSTELHFNYQSLSYKIIQDHKMPFTFKDLSSGYSSILKVFLELLMQIEVSEFNPKIISGFVIIDEIDAHLHASLQRKVLPFFTSMFPNIQFIVSTHSPFVINSDEDTIVYDLSRSQFVDGDLSFYGLDTIVEGILDVPSTSLKLEKSVSELTKYENAFTKKYTTLINDFKKNEVFLDDETKGYFQTALYNLNQLPKKNEGA